MGPLNKILLGLALALVAGPAAAAPVDRWAAEIALASARFGIPTAWIRKVIEAESGGRTLLNGVLITSSAGAMGLMQLMPGTWAEMRRAHGLGFDPFDPQDNILAGTAYLRAMYDAFGYPGLFGAYNAGPERYRRFLATGRPLPSETRLYVARVTGGVSFPAVARRSSGRSLAGSAARTAAALGQEWIFALRHDTPVAPQNTIVQQADPLFAVRR